MKTNLPHLLIPALALALAGALHAQTGPQRYVVDPAASVLKWHGSKVGADHFGKIKLKSGWLELKDGQITGGEFVADMTSIANDDLTSKTQNRKLVTHLMSDDFFAVKQHPESRFVIARGTAMGGGDYEIQGRMTIRGIMQPLSFTANIRVSGNQLIGNGKLTFNRASHDVKFNSGTFAKLGNKLIRDDVPLDIELVARSQ